MENQIFKTLFHYLKKILICLLWLTRELLWDIQFGVVEWLLTESAKRCNF